MATATPEQAVEQARAAATLAKQAAELAERYAEQAATAAGVATGVDPTVYRLAIFALAVFVGYYVVWSVTPALHTPLMSVTNAISSVIVVGALLAVGVSAAEQMGDGPLWAKIFGFIALVLASVNIFGGFLVTERMLSMYKKKG
ncbi:NAD(P) transhydrogenase subunit alpha [Bosea sp. BK604]|uniref:NAD(P) transhydrogenase subunit alpha n=1 Tax=Bosea sp. BK604 TaxID=2512180 RepID=UPI00104C9812|nr:NAD(P) transhydrogenase subunit alpha [Bosea sp. BK604]TCR70277.1 NAD(P) transhydrogenase subunit alpha [Bosea sp. BK604]